MPLTRQDILDYGLRYVPHEEVVDFPVEGDLFAFLVREVDPARADGDDTGWTFGGYGVCFGYDLDTTEKPEGKWVWMKYGSMLTFPPLKQHLMLQPPHVVKGRFQTADRSQDVRIVKVNPAVQSVTDETTAPPQPTEEPPKRKPRRSSTDKPQGKILEFRQPKRPERDPGSGGNHDPAV